MNGCVIRNLRKTGTVPSSLTFVRFAWDSPRLSALLMVFALFAGCATTESAPDGAPQSQVEVRQFQTRSYDVAEQALVMKAMLNVLQDLSFIVRTADAQLGVISAEKWSNIEHSKKELKKAKKEKIALPQTAVMECTANVTMVGGRAQVRVVFQQRVMGPGGTVVEVTRVEDAAFYQEFFARVDKGIFLQQQGI